MTHLEERWDVVESAARRHIRLLQMKGVDPRVLLREIAQWYGVLVPSSHETWQFVHKTVHDYLAARFWVDSRGFGSENISQWSTRAAYATCLLPDATKKLIEMLSIGGTMALFRECLYNRAAFDADEIAEAVIGWNERFGKVLFVERETGIAVELADDFFSLCSEEFLCSLAIAADLHRGDFSKAIALFSLGELARRKKTMSSGAFRLHMLALLSRAYEVRVELRRHDAPQIFRLKDVVTP